MRGKGWKEKEPRAEGEGPTGSLMPLRCKKHEVGPGQRNCPSPLFTT